jgi:hypothetical protein
MTTCFDLGTLGCSGSRGRRVGLGEERTASIEGFLRRSSCEAKGETEGDPAEDASEKEASVSSKLSSEESVSTRCLRGVLRLRSLGGFSDPAARLYIDVGGIEGDAEAAVI